MVYFLNFPLNHMVSLKLLYYIERISVPEHCLALCRCILGADATRCKCLQMNCVGNGTICHKNRQNEATTIHSNNPEIEDACICRQKSRLCGNWRACATTPTVCNSAPQSVVRNAHIATWFSKEWRQSGNGDNEETSYNRGENATKQVHDLDHHHIGVFL